VASVASGIAKVFLVGAAVGVAAELWGVRQEQSRANLAQAGALSGQTATFTQVAGVAEMQKSLQGILAYDQRLNNNSDLLNATAIAYQLNIDGVRDAVLAQAATLRSAISRQTDLERGVGAGTITGLGQVAAAAQRDADASSRAAAGSYAAAAGSQAAAAAIRDKDSSVDVSVKVTTYVTAAQINQGVTNQRRYGHGGGSASGRHVNII